MDTTGQAPRWKVTLADNTVDEQEIEAVTAVLRSRWLSVGEQTRLFEQEFAAKLGVPDAVAVSSGTAALHLAAMSLDLRPGDEVIVPSLSFVASAEVIALCGGVPVFADVRSPADLTIDPADVRRLITSRTRAIVGMHYGGYVADTAALRACADEHCLRLIEDAAHAPVVRQGELMAGTWGDIGCFSFFATKNVTTGEGGMVVARDAGLRDHIRRMRSHCIATSAWDRMRTGAVDYDVAAVGLNYRPTDISSALGRVQLGKLDIDRDRRRGLVATYRAALSGVDIPFAAARTDSAHHLMAVLLPPGLNRERVRADLATAGIQTSVHYPPTHRFSFYRRLFASGTRVLPVTESVAPRLLSLPLHSRMSDDDAVFVADRLSASVRNLTTTVIPR
jgi:dTDP-4-amino-4,6-dideoxygalactose transaminase